MDYSSRSSAICHLINSENEFESINYYAVETDPHGLCMNFTIPDRTNSTKGLQGALDLRGWSIMALYFFTFVFIVVFHYYSLAFLCLFYPTEILQDGVTHIILEGASPVSLRSFAGNFFFLRKREFGAKQKHSFWEFLSYLFHLLSVQLPLRILNVTVFSKCHHT